MLWELLVQFALMQWAVTYLVLDSAILAWARIELAKGSIFRTQLFYCPSCFGFWVGLLLGALGYWPFASGWVAVAESGAAALVLGRLYALWFQTRAFELELPSLDLPDPEEPPVEGAGPGASAGD